MKTKSNARNLVTIAAAANYAGVHPMTMRRWVSAGYINAFRMGPRLLKVDLNELDGMLEPIPNAKTAVGA